MQHFIVNMMFLFLGGALAERGVDLNNPTDMIDYWHDKEPGSPLHNCLLRLEDQPSRQLALPNRLTKPTTLFGHVLDEGNDYHLHLHKHLTPDVAHLETMIYNRPMTLHDDLLQNAISNLGDPSRLQAFFRKLLSGQPITMVALGGSITCGGLSSGELSYIDQVFEWIKMVFPHPDHKFLNYCKGGTGSVAASLCFDTTMPAGPDLITMEFTVNDAEGSVPSIFQRFKMDGRDLDSWYRDLNSEDRRGFEVLLRKALLHPNQPAVLYLHAWTAPFEGFTFWRGVEADMATILEYYRIPSLSMRRALYRNTMERTLGFRPTDYICDMYHPNWLGHRYYADVMVAFLQRHAWAARTTPHSTIPVREDIPNLPQPLIENNWEAGLQCSMNHRLHQSVQSSEGWEWVDEGKDGSSKWGWRSITPGTKLVTKPIDTTSAVLPANASVLLIVGILHSYEHMGRVELACESGCECIPLQIDSQHTEHTSVMKQVYHTVSQHTDCVASLKVLQHTSSGGHKVKVDMLALSTSFDAEGWQRWHAPLQGVP